MSRAVVILPDSTGCMACDSVTVMGAKQQGRFMGKTFAATFKFLSILAGGLSLFVLLQMVFDFGVAPALVIVIQSYQNIIYPFVNWLERPIIWVIGFIDWSLPEFWRELLVLYCVSIGAFARSESSSVGVGFWFIWPMFFLGILTVAIIGISVNFMRIVFFVLFDILRWKKVRRIEYMKLATVDNTPWGSVSPLDSVRLTIISFVSEFLLTCFSFGVFFVINAAIQ